MARWSRHYGPDIAQAIADAHRHEPPLDLTVKDSADSWAARLRGRVLPTGTVRLVAHGPVARLPGYDRGRLVGAGRRRRPAGSAARRRARPQRRRPVRGAGRQDGAARARRRARHRGRSLGRAAGAARGKSRAARACGRDRRGRCDANGRAGRSMPSWSMRRARRPARSAAIPTSPISSARRTLRRLAALQQQLLDRAVALTRPGGTIVYCSCSLEPEEGEGADRGAAGARAARSGAARCRRTRSPAMARVRDPGGRSAHPALPLARPRSAHGRVSTDSMPPGWSERLSELPQSDPRLAARTCLAASCAALRSMVIPLVVVHVPAIAMEHSGQAFGTLMGKESRSMSRGLIAERARLSWFVARRALLLGVARMNAHPLVRWRFTSTGTDRLLIAPQDLRTADPTRASEIYARPVRLRGQDRHLRRPLPVRDAAAVGGMGRGAVRLRLAAPPARRRIGHHPRQCAGAGRRMDLAAGVGAIRSPGGPTWWRGASCRG